MQGSIRITGKKANSVLRFGLNIRQVGGEGGEDTNKPSWVCAALRHTARRRRLRVSLQEEPSLYRSSDM